MQASSFFAVDRTQNVFVREVMLKQPVRNLCHGEHNPSDGALDDGRCDALRRRGLV